MKKIIYVIITVLILITALSRVTVKTNMGKYGLKYEKLYEPKGIIVQATPFYFGEGYKGSMKHLLILSVLTLIAISINFKFDSNNILKRNFYFSIYGISLLLFSESIIKLLGVLIVYLIIKSFLNNQKINS